MNEHIRALVEEIHNCSTKVTLVVTGAGSQAIAWLLSVGGASRTVLEAVIPYGRRALVDYLGWRPEQYVSAHTAVSLAAAAYSRAQQLREADEPVIGVSCTATIVTDHPKRGEYRCHVGIWAGHTVTTYSLGLEKGLRDRHGQEMIVSQLILRAVAKACGLQNSISVNLEPNEIVEVKTEPVDHPLGRLMADEIDSLTFYGPGAMVANEPLRGPMLSGSFNPLHAGHIRLAQVVEERLGQRVVFEIPIVNADKPALAIEQIEAKLVQFAGTKWRVVLTREALYRDKARLFPGSTFVIGYDTAVRLLNPTYYGGQSGLTAAMEAIREAGCQFLVAGRLVNSRFRTLDDLEVPKDFESLFRGIPEGGFRVDVSSTELRQRGKRDP